MKRNSLISLCLAGLVAALSTGCNSNPVVAPQATDTLLGYSQNGKLAESNSVDILWVIDNSGSMGDEQFALIEQFQLFLLGLRNDRVSFQMAVTTTEGELNKENTQTKTGTTDRYLTGEFRTKANPKPGPSSYFGLTFDHTLGAYYKKDEAFKNSLKASITNEYSNLAMAAWYCTNLGLGGEDADVEAAVHKSIEAMVKGINPNAVDKDAQASKVRSLEEPLKTYFKAVNTLNKTKLERSKTDASKTAELEKLNQDIAKQEIVVNSSKAVLLSTIKGLVGEALDAVKPFKDDPASPYPNLDYVFPVGSSYEEFPAIVKSTEPDEEKLLRHLSCLALVGTEGAGVEKGFQAMLSAVDREKDSNVPAEAKLVRGASKFGVIFVSDENDCTHGPEYSGNGTDFNDNNCHTNICNLFSATNIQNNPMISVETAKTKLLQGLQEVKTSKTIDQEDVIVAAITGVPKPVEIGVGNYGNPQKDKLANVTNQIIVESFLGNSTPPDVCEQYVPHALKTGSEPSASTYAGKRALGSVCAEGSAFFSTTGDRYNSFANLFTSHFPKEGAGTLGGEGVLCDGSFGEAIKAISNLISQTAQSCIDDQLAHQEQCQSSTDTCGDNTPCQQIVGTGTDPQNNPARFYCPLDLQVVVSAKDQADLDALKNPDQTQSFCDNNATSSPENFNFSCYLAPDKYEIKVCNGAPDKGFKFELKNEDQVLKGQLKAVNLDIFYTAVFSEKNQVN